MATAIDYLAYLQERQRKAPSNGMLLAELIPDERIRFRIGARDPMMDGTDEPTGEGG